ncbi:unnamed protein product (macronuclear) [Paramecium tetraurelia]|uniref:Cation/H+ exchanger transmembrane domain-containing protein n=1 Tax=Paramecium tetraurelia TaxID=5888 RepID=A0CNU1_PARTE|nr:uncharacterized protein GSPATT00008900001 [Paramecium tetraurelia]CAK72458.1 unnamed protein product [Paramecium tetraurelia]|eukprot:XP_001439855.1 hypothetical protein (macronuclear) [Paramecium tetraurelia strain d4-2]
MEIQPFIQASNLDTKSLITGGIFIAFTTILGVIALLQTYCEHRHYNLLREASVAILIGLLIGVITEFQVLQNVNYDNSSEIFFFVLLPIIVFKEGYNLNKQHFMKNFFYVVLYGIFGTIFNFIVLAALNYSITNTTIFWIPPSKDSQNNTPINSRYASTFYSACISSKDSAVSLSVLEFEHAPKLHSIIFGEQILNDVVVFAISKTVEKFHDQSESKSDWEWYSVFIFIGWILANLLVGLIVGVLVGSMATWITKESRFLSEHSSVATAFTIYIAYFAFCVCEAIGFCGVLAVLLCGIMLSHYQTYNLPKISATSSKITIKALAYISETIIYFYIGYMVTENAIVKDQQDSNLKSQVYTFLLIQYFVFSPVAKLSSMLLAHGFAIMQIDHHIHSIRMKTKGPWRINKYEFFLLFYSGLIKGVVAYALMCEQDVGGKDYYKIIQTTSLYMVVFTTLINGGTLKYVCEWAYRRMEKENSTAQTRTQSSQSYAIRQTFIQEDLAAYKKLKNKSEKFFKGFDEKYIKPFLIYKYNQRKDDIRLAKKLQKNKSKYEKEQDFKMYDDSIRQQREELELHKQKRNELTQIDYSNSDSDDEQNNHQNGNQHTTFQGELQEVKNSKQQNGDRNHD